MIPRYRMASGKALNREDAKDAEDFLLEHGLLKVVLCVLSVRHVKILSVRIET